MAAALPAAPFSPSAFADHGVGGKAGLVIGRILAERLVEITGGAAVRPG